jgi:hypothetical protein
VQFPLQIEVRYPPGSRPLRPSRHARSTRQPCHTLHSASTTPANRTHHKGRAAALECGQDDPPFDLRRHHPLQRPGIPSHHPQVCPQPGRLSRMRRSFGRPCRCAREAVAHAARARARSCARAQCPLPRLPDSVDSAPAEARCSLRWPSARVRTRRLACFADGLRVASPMQAAAAANGHLALDISATTGRCNVDTTVTRGSGRHHARALPHGPGGADLCL